tara:strand:- start:2188 stop:2958 length:771 start_codon:yes stop_codon:yes gene_type:complete
MKNNCIVLTHVLIKKSEEHKKEIVEKTVDTFRKLNPNSYIILTGHGLKPMQSTIDKVDYFYWEETIRTEQFGSGHPHFVHLAYKHAAEKGFTHAFKSRADCPCLIPNICDKMHQILENEQTKMVVTEMTSIKMLYIGDLFLYAPLDVLIKSWSRWNCNHGGLQNYANNWMEDHGLPRNNLANLHPPEHWESLVLNTLSYRDMSGFGCINLEDFWSELREVDLLEIKDFSRYLWGAKWDYPRQITFEEFYRKKNDRS